MNRTMNGVAGLIVGFSLAAAPALAQTAGAPGGAMGAFGAGAYGGGAHGAGGYGETAPVVAPIPQYWLADTALFVGSAANAAQMLSLEQGINVQAPQVLGNQAQFLLATTNRALTSLEELQANAEETNPAAVPGIRMAIGQLAAARAQAAQAAAAMGHGLLGPAFTTTVRSALAHLAAAERELQVVGRAYGVPQLATAGACSASGAAFGVGLGQTVP